MIRFYNVELYPSSIILPVSECNEANYSLYAKEGGPGGYEEEAWSNFSKAEARGFLRAAHLQAQADKEAGMVGEEVDVADPIPAEAQAQFTSAGVIRGSGCSYTCRRNVRRRRGSFGGREGEETKREGYHGRCGPGGLDKQPEPSEPQHTILDLTHGSLSKQGNTVIETAPLFPTRTQIQGRKAKTGQLVMNHINCNRKMRRTWTWEAKVEGENGRWTLETRVGGKGWEKV